jgi:hypothetical protein
MHRFALTCLNWVNRKFNKLENQQRRGFIAKKIRKLPSRKIKIRKKTNLPHPVLLTAKEMR